MSTVFTEGNYLGDVLFYEGPLHYSRDIVTVLSGQNLALGTIVGIVTASGKVKILAPAASDGSQTAVGMMALSCDASLADTTSIAITRHAILKETSLVWPAGITAPQKATAIAQLKAAGILIRTGA